jgi:antitoxin (DNA-binding transcriptional repressor) of toxin-antitoxin stability system
MAGTVYISEAEAARDFAAVVDRTLKGEQIVVRRDGCDVIRLSPIAAAPEGLTRSLGEVIDGLRRREAEQGLATADDEFAADMERVHRELNLPMDSTKWD